MRWRIAAPTTRESGSMRKRKWASATDGSPSSTSARPWQIPTAAAKATGIREATINPAQALFDVKRLIGRRLKDTTVHKDMKLLPFKIGEKQG